VDDVGLLRRVLPAWVQEEVERHGTGDLEEIVMDLERPLALRYPEGYEYVDRLVLKDDIHHVVHRVRGFREDNRTGIDRTVHRISCVRDRYGEIVGLTVRVGRAVVGAAEFIRDVVLGGSVLFVGPPGSGKTTLLRDAARILSERLGPKVVIVDTSNEIGGDGKVPHPAIGKARRIQVPDPSVQAKVLMQAVANHGPAAIVIDEIGFYGDVDAVVTIARRGVQMLATVHGSELRDVVENPHLAPLLGGIAQSGAARRRLAPPVFGSLVEVVGRDRVVVHKDLAASVDAVLRGEDLPDGVELRVRIPPEATEEEADRIGLGALPDAVERLVERRREAIRRTREILRGLLEEGHGGTLH
jgi:stage III sporulation protein SpoIIIAA